MRANVVVDALAGLAPALHRAFLAEHLDALDRAVNRDPGHDLRVGELATAAAYLPQSLVGLAPYFFEMLRQRPLHVPRRVIACEAALAALMQRVHDFAVNVELQLDGSGVADSHGSRRLVTLQPPERHLGQPALAGEAVHDLRLAGAAGHGANQPLAPGRGFVVVAGIH